MISHPISIYWQIIIVVHCLYQRLRFPTSWRSRESCCSRKKSWGSSENPHILFLLFL